MTTAPSADQQGSDPTLVALWMRAIRDHADAANSGAGPRELRRLQAAVETARVAATSYQPTQPNPDQRTTRRRRPAVIARDTRTKLAQVQVQDAAANSQAARDAQRAEIDLHAAVTAGAAEAALTELAKVFAAATERVTTLRRRMG